MPPWCQTRVFDLNHAREARRIAASTKFKTSGRRALISVGQSRPHRFHDSHHELSIVGL
jgi:hypothetical protein